MKMTTRLRELMAEGKTKLESYMLEGSFEQAQFFADIEGHPDDPAVKRALDELTFFTKTLRVLGTYPRDPFRG